MIQVTEAVQTVIDSGCAWYADLYKFALVSGQIIRLTSADINVTWEGETYLSKARADVPLIDRGDITFELGLTVDQFELTLSHSPSMRVAGMPWPMALRVGLFDAAEVDYVRAVGAFGSGVVAGIIPRFSGKVGPVDPGRTTSTITIDSHAADLQVPVPRNVFQASCLNTVYDATCGLNRSSREVHVTVSSVSEDGMTIGISGATLVADKYLGGFARFTGLSVSNSNQQVTVWDNTTSSITLLYPFPDSLSIGETLALAPGCTKSMEACAEFDVVHWRDRFRGQPHVPLPETVL